MVVVMKLADLIAHWRPGSKELPWSWGEEVLYLTSDEHAARTAGIREDIALNGILEPVHLGHDGRVWDGHHRVVAAIQLGITDIPVEIATHPLGGLPREQPTVR